METEQPVLVRSHVREYYRAGTSECTKRVLSRKQFQRHRREAEAAGLSPLRRERYARNLTQEEAAEAALVSRKSWSSAEANTANVSEVTLARIAASFALPVSALRD